MLSIGMVAAVAFTAAIIAAVVGFTVGIGAAAVGFIAAVVGGPAAGAVGIKRKLGARVNVG
jgi:hypothetical protein